MSADTSWRQTTVRNNNGSASFASLQYRLPQPALAGNCLVAAVLFAGVGWTSGTDPAVPTISDDQGGTWILVKDVQWADFINGPYHLAVWVSPNAVAGTHRLTVTWTGAQAFATEFIGGERWNTATSSVLDGTAVGTTVQANATPFAVQSGNLSTAVDGDCIIQIAACGNAAGGVGNDTTGTWVADSGYNIAAANKNSALAMQSSIQAVHSATTNPSLNVTGLNGAFFLTVTFALKTAAAGTAPDLTTPNIRAINHETVISSSSVPTTYTFSFPTRSNCKLLVGLFSGDGATNVPIISGVTDNKGNSYVVKTGVGTHTEGVAQSFYALNPIVGEDLKLTVAFTGHADNDGGSNVFLYEVQCNTALQFDTISSFSGSVTLGATWQPGTVAPSATGGIMFGWASVQNGHLQDCSSPWTAHQDEDPNSTGTSPIDEDNGWAHYVPTSTAATGPTWGNTLTGTSDNSAQIISFAQTTVPATWRVGTRMAPQRGPFDRRGFLLSPYQRYSYVAVAAIAATTLQRKTLSPLGTHTGGRQSQ